MKLAGLNILEKPYTFFDFKIQKTTIADKMTATFLFFIFMEVNITILPITIAPNKPPPNRMRIPSPTVIL